MKKLKLLPGIAALMMLTGCDLNFPTDISFQPKSTEPEIQLTNQNYVDAIEDVQESLNTGTKVSSAPRVRAKRDDKTSNKNIIDITGCSNLKIELQDLFEDYIDENILDNIDETIELATQVGLDAMKYMIGFGIELDVVNNYVNAATDFFLGKNGAFEFKYNANALYLTVGSNETDDSTIGDFLLEAKVGYDKKTYTVSDYEIALLINEKNFGTLFTGAGDMSFYVYGKVGEGFSFYSSLINYFIKLGIQATTFPDNLKESMIAGLSDTLTPQVKELHTKFMGTRPQGNGKDVSDAFNGKSGKSGKGK